MGLMNAQVVFLDFGGTLARQTNSREEAIAASLAEMGRPVAIADAARAVAAARERFAGRSPSEIAVCSLGIVPPDQRHGYSNIP